MSAVLDNNQAIGMGESYLFPTDNEGHFQRALLLECFDCRREAGSLVRSLGVVILHARSARIMMQTWDMPKLTLGSLATLGTLKVANVDMAAVLVGGRNNSCDGTDLIDLVERRRRRLAALAVVEFRDDSIRSCCAAILREGVWLFYEKRECVTITVRLLGT